MSVVSENGILAQRDFEKFKEHSVASKFKNQIFLGIGGATVFGLVGAFGKSLLEIAMPTATTSAGAATVGATAAAPALLFGLTASAWAWVGLAAIAAVGIGCLYLGSRFLAESILMDQDFQAKKIAMASDPARAQALLQSPPEPTKNPVTPPGMALHEQHASEASHESKWAEKVGQRHHTEKHADAHEKKPHDTNIPKPHVDSWAEEVNHADQQPVSRSVH